MLQTKCIGVVDFCDSESLGRKSIAKNAPKSNPCNLLFFRRLRVPKKLLIFFRGLPRGPVFLKSRAMDPTRLLSKKRQARERGKNEGTIFRKGTFVTGGLNNVYVGKLRPHCVYRCLQTHRPAASGLIPC